MTRQAMRLALLGLGALAAAGCAGGDSKPQPWGGDGPPPARDSASWLDGDPARDVTTPRSDTVSSEDGPAGDGPAASDAATPRPDLPAGGALMDDVCPPTTAAITGDLRLQGQTSQQNITGACGQSNPYGQAVAITLTEQKKIELTVTCDASLTVLTVRTGCSAVGCKAGDAKSGMTWTTSAKDPGTYNIVVTTNDPASYILEVRLLAP